MKNIKRLFVAVLTFVLSICMINTVSAATEKGSIVISGTTSEKIYEVYKIFDLTYSGSGDNLKVAYTIDSAWTNFFSSTGSEYIVSTNTGDLNAITVETATGYETRYINITEDNIADFAKAALAYLGANNIEKTAYKEATGETTTIDNLELGYYLVYPEGATKIKDEWKSIVSLTSTTPNAEVNIKATYPTINKVGDGPSYEVGTFATFTITGNVPDTTGFTTYTYKIHDTWTKGLEYEANDFNLIVTIGDYTLSNDEYTLTMKLDEEDSTEPKDIIGFELTLNVMDDKYEVGDAITVTYQVRVNSFAINSKTTNNSAYLEYSNNPNKTTTSTTTPIEVPVYSSSLAVLKVDGVDKTTPLAGAEFVLKNEDGKYYSIKSWGWDQADDGSNIARVYEIEWKDNLEDATVFTSNDEGIVAVEFDLLFTYELTAFEGLKDGTYYLVETKAPEGYNKLDSEIPVVVDGTTENNREVPVVKEVTVENNSGTALPSTGGIGTKLFIAIGSLLAVISAIVLVTNKRMAKEFM